MRVVVAVLLVLLVGGPLLHRADPALLNGILTVTGQVGREKKSPQWVQDWLTAFTKRFPDASNQVNLRCTDGTNGWDYQCTYFDVREGGIYHFGAYVYNLPSGPIVNSGSDVPVDQPIPQPNYQAPTPAQLSDPAAGEFRKKFKRVKVGSRETGAGGMTIRQVVKLLGKPGKDDIIVAHVGRDTDATYTYPFYQATGSPVWIVDFTNGKVTAKFSR